MGDGGGKLVAADESALVAKPLLDTVVVENGQGDRLEVPHGMDDILGQVVTVKEEPRCWR